MTDPPPSTVPNVVVIVVHDLGDYLGCYGHKVVTPHLDRLAAEGVRFTSHCTTAAFCSPARGSIVTGQYPHSNGLLGLCNLGWSLPEHNVTDAQRFEAAGYRTCLVGFQHEKPSGADLRFQENYSRRYITSSNYATDYVAECADERLRLLAGERAAGGDRRPFYMRVGTYSVHRNLAPVSGSYGYDLMHDRGLPEAEVEIWPAWMDTPGLRYDLAGFTGEVNNMDRGVGTILAALRTHGFEDNTLVVFTTDHGIDFPRAKGTLYDAGIRTALLMRLPGGARAGTVVSGLSSHVDILPTLLDYCAAPGADEMQGLSLRPLIEGRRAAIHEQVFAEESTLPNNVMRAVRTERYKLIRNFSRGIRSHVGVCAGGRTEIDTGDFYFAERPAYELYDVAADPAEACNLSGLPRWREEETRLRGELERWMKATDDPALTGSIRRPPDEFERFCKAHSQALNRHTEPFWVMPGQDQ
jgi:N-sulfoglucosamine sulfohydrolase